MISRWDFVKKPSPGKASNRSFMLTQTWYDIYPKTWIMRAYTHHLWIDPFALCELRYGSLSKCRWRISVDVNRFCFVFHNWDRLIHFPLRPTLSYQRLQTVQPLSDVELYDKIRRTVANKHELQVFESFLVFNKYLDVYLRSSVDPV